MPPYFTPRTRSSSGRWTSRSRLGRLSMTASTSPLPSPRNATSSRLMPCFAAAGHPGFQVVLAVRRAAEVAGAGVDDVIREAKALEDALLDGEQFQVQRFALLRRAEGEHLDLRELVDTVQALGVAPRSAGLG